jgi:hypothetical protein
VRRDLRESLLGLLPLFASALAFVSTLMKNCPCRHRRPRHAY